MRHRQLLDAAHIIPDVEARGDPTVSNGLALCKLHHAAFDSFMIGISPDCEVFVWENILHEVDGPILVHSLQGWHGQAILLPGKFSPGRRFIAEICQSCPSTAMESADGSVLLISSCVPSEVYDRGRGLSLKVSLDLLPHLFED
ncbi:MAG: HNH endonuclease [Anaerolineales bacterium]|nr:HNH endonuclease [Anaerolineales bacterium]